MGDVVSLFRYRLFLETRAKSFPRNVQKKTKRLMSYCYFPKDPFQKINNVQYNQFINYISLRYSFNWTIRSIYLTQHPGIFHSLQSKTKCAEKTHICLCSRHRVQRDKVTAMFSKKEIPRMSPAMAPSSHEAQRAQLRKGRASKVTAAVTAHVRKLCFQRAILGRKFQHTTFNVYAQRITFSAVVIFVILNGL